jgi:murein DD-endopeptidase
MGRMRSLGCLGLLALAACRAGAPPSGQPAVVPRRIDAGTNDVRTGATETADASGPTAAAAIGGRGEKADAGAPVTCDGWQLLDTTVRGSISESFVAALAADGAELAAHLARIFMWDLNLHRDVEPGDRVRLIWRRNAAGDPEIRAARYQSLRLGKSLWVYRFSAAKDEYPSYWDREGVETPRRLKASPLLDYEQITALLKDRPTHQGLDFKTPEGTPVHAPRAGVATRLDWKLHGNGHCVELRYADGTLAKFLHLSAIKVRGGARVRAGQVIALTGNTGHSTAPHLHYQLSRGTRTLDPVDYHGVERRRLEGAALAAFRAELADFDQRCAAAVP